MVQYIIDEGFTFCYIKGEYINDKAVQHIKDIENNGICDYEIIGYYINDINDFNGVHTKLLIRKNGILYNSPTVNNLKRRKFGKSPIYTIDNYQYYLKKFQKQNNELLFKIEIKDKFTDINTNMLITCLNKECNDIHTISLYNLLNKVSGCLSCDADKTIYTKENYKKILYRKRPYENTKIKIVGIVNEHEELTVLSYIWLKCDCGNLWNASINKFYNGLKGCPACAGKNQQQCYINIILDNDIPIALKYGIAVNHEIREKLQNKSSIYDIQTLGVWEFDNVCLCKSAENECSKTFTRVLEKREMKDGYTETTSVNNIDKIIEIYENWGGIRIK